MKKTFKLSFIYVRTSFAPSNLRRSVNLAPTALDSRPLGVHSIHNDCWPLVSNFPTAHALKALDPLPPASSEFPMREARAALANPL